MSAEHLDLDALADLLAADALTNDDLGGDLGHLAQCPACQATLAELEAYCA